MKVNSLLVAALSHLVLRATGFIVQGKRLPTEFSNKSPSSSIGNNNKNKLFLSTGSSTADSDNNIIETADFLQVKAPLKYIATYPCLSLRFPKLATANQRPSGKSGVSLDFVLATATNVNTIANEVATQLQLSSVGEALPDFGASSGAQSGGQTYLLGDVQLEGQEPLFMLGLTAAALPITNPVAAGTLSLAFMQSFDGIDFGWGIVEGDKVLRRPSFTFYGGTIPSSVTEGRTLVKMNRIPGTQSPIVTILVNGVETIALLDTGSPISVLMPTAAERAGVERIKSPSPGAGEKFTVAGERGQLVDLVKSESKVSIMAPGATSKVDFGSEHLFVGEIPSLAALGKLQGVENPPLAVLGLDILQRRPSMLLRAKDNHNELWFE